MKKLLLSFILLCNCVIALEITGTVIKIVDGDTITILDNNNIQHKIRLRDIDAPEKKQPFYNKSKENLAKHISGKIVTIEYDKKDKYKRILGTVYYNNKDINLQQIKEGFAFVYKKYSKNQTYYNAEKLARENKKGLWIDNNPIPPWDFRKQ